MTALFQTAVAVTQEIEVEFPNLFGGLAINYYRGFTLFGIPIYWYGVIITVGVILAYLYAMHRTKEFGLSKDRVFDVVFAALIGGFLGARIYYCVFQTLDPNSGVKYDFITTFTGIRDGGLAIYGGIIGGFLVGFIACKIRKVHFLSMCDLASFGFLIGQTLGRWGNFVNQEAYGSVADPDWLFGMTGTIISENIEAGAVVHPCFLYESVWCLIGFIGLHFYSKKLRTFDGEIFLLYIAWYGLGRAFIEGLRTDSLMIGDFRVSQLLAAVSFVAATALFIVFKILTEKKQIPLYVNTDASKAILDKDRLEAEAAAAKKAAKKAAKEGVAPSIIDESAEDITFDGDNDDSDTDVSGENKDGDPENEEQADEGFAPEKTADSDLEIEEQANEGFAPEKTADSDPENKRNKEDK
ncbi:MAG: prolipoprotein diacylglyceryl transferase [Oscillospiraceae bacterium]